MLTVWASWDGVLLELPSLLNDWRRSSGGGLLHDWRGSSRGGLLHHWGGWWLLHNWRGGPCRCSSSCSGGWGRSRLLYNGWCRRLLHNWRGRSCCGSSGCSSGWGRSWLLYDGWGRSCLLDLHLSSQYTVTVIKTICLSSRQHMKGKLLCSRYLTTHAVTSLHNVFWKPGCQWRLVLWWRTTALISRHSR